MSTARGIALAAVSMAVLACPRVEAKPRTGFEVWGGWSQYSMADANDTLSSFNAEYRTALAPIRKGPSGGLGFRLWPREDVLVRLGVERLWAQSQDSGVEFELGAYAITLGATRYFPSSSRVRFGAGLGLGPYFATGGLNARGATLGASGTGFGGHLAGEAAVAIGGGCSLQGVAGYRWASIPSQKFGEYSSNLSVQYSGLFVRVGLAFDGRREN